MAELLVFKAELKKPLTYADFDTKILKKTFRQAGGEIRKIARRLVEALQKPSLILRSESFCLLHRLNFCANDCSGYF